MKNSKLECAHWLILAVAICFYIIILTLAPHQKITGQEILMQKNPSPIIDTSQKSSINDDPIIDVNAFVINGDTLANENI